ncbi:hypothetical protein [Halorhabdus rudnickae]|uniref:hypothetical protein n=1 Tax=Halorhabdus rudnickae TaxID=1775544 RepID=UPI001083E8BC|nr:hypothetical protein [Halorhabdus rudnickae]
MSEPTVERVDHERWGESVRIANGTIELLAPTTIGPRIVRFGFEGGPNEFQLFEEGRDEWPLVGGHRLWHAPENSDRTYEPDMDPIEAEVLIDGVRLVGPEDPGAGVQKAITVRMGTGASVEVEHELTNRNPWPIEFAPWGISVLKPHGTAVLPFTPQADEDSLLPDRSIQLWPYTTPGDDRIDFGDEYVSVSQDTDRDPMKIATSGADGWLAYHNDGHVFRKDYPYDPDGTYPDAGSAAEAYTDQAIMEIESLSPIRTVEPGETATHTETWTVAEGVDAPADAAEVEPDDV